MENWNKFEECFGLIFGATADFLEVYVEMELKFGLIVKDLLLKVELV